MEFQTRHGIPYWSGHSNIMEFPNQTWNSMFGLEFQIGLGIPNLTWNSKSAMEFPDQTWNSMFPIMEFQIINVIPYWSWNSVTPGVLCRPNFFLGIPRFSGRLFHPCTLLMIVSKSAKTSQYESGSNCSY